MDGVTENPAVGAVESWIIRNFTMDAHPIHIHQVQFQVMRRIVTDPMVSPHGTLGRVRSATRALGDRLEGHRVVYPGELTRVKARFDIAGLFVWHCHIIEHEDNEMMRPFRVGPAPAASPVTTQPQ